MRRTLLATWPSPCCSRAGAPTPARAPRRHLLRPPPRTSTAVGPAPGTEPASSAAPEPSTACVEDSVVAAGIESLPQFFGSGWRLVRQGESLRDPLVGARGARRGHGVESVDRLVLPRRHLSRYRHPRCRTRSPTSPRRPTTRSRCRTGGSGRVSPPRSSPADPVRPLHLERIVRGDAGRPAAGGGGRQQADSCRSVPGPTRWSPPRSTLCPPSPTAPGAVQPGRSVRHAGLGDGRSRRCPPFESHDGPALP